MKLYTIVGGVNGVGKSSFTGVLKAAGKRSQKFCPIVMRRNFMTITTVLY